MLKKLLGIVKISQIMAVNAYYQFQEMIKIAKIAIHKVLKKEVVPNRWWYNSLFREQQ